MKLKTAVAILMFSLVTSFAAVAGTVTMQFNSTGSNSYNGVPTYPYDLTVNGYAASLMCVSYNEHITGGETWDAKSYSVDNYGALIGDVQKADQLAYLFTLAHADGGVNPAYNAAAWFLNEGAPSLDAAAQAIYDQAVAMTFGPNAFPTIQVYVPIAGTQSWAGELPQTFLGSTPEPGTLLMVGSGLLALAGVTRKHLSLN